MTVQGVVAQVLGFIPTGGPTPGTPTISLTTNTTFIGYSFIAPAATSLSTTRCFSAGAIGGTGGTIGCTLQTDNNGAPSGTVIDTLSVGTVANNSYITATGVTNPTLTLGTKYWCVWSNSDAAPATNFIRAMFMNNTVAFSVSGDDAATTTNGTTWTQKNCGGGARFDFADGSNLGFPVTVQGALPLAQGVYQANEAGIQFTTPANGKLVVRGLSMFITRAGTPTGNPFFKLYDSSHNLLGSTFAISNGDAFTNTVQWYHRNFDPSTISGGASTITLQPSTQYTVTMAESTQSDTSANRFSNYAYTWDSDATSLAMIPWSMRGDFFQGGSWSQTTGLLPVFALLLQSGGEFAGGGGSSGFFIQ
jgi:hypothetical protein